MDSNITNILKKQYSKIEVPNFGQFVKNAEGDLFIFGFMLPFLSVRFFQKLIFCLHFHVKIYSKDEKCANGFFFKLKLLLKNHTFLGKINLKCIPKSR